MISALTRLHHRLCRGHHWLPQTQSIASICRSIGFGSNASGPYSLVFSSLSLRCPDAFCRQQQETHARHPTSRCRPRFVLACHPDVSLVCMESSLCFSGYLLDIAGGVTTDWELRHSLLAANAYTAARRCATRLLCFCTLPSRLSPLSSLIYRELSILTTRFHGCGVVLLSFIYDHPLPVRHKTHRCKQIDG